MPTYEFKCKVCGQVRSIKCLPENLDEMKLKMWCHNRQMTRLFGTTTIVFKGEGWACKTGRENGKTRMELAA